jgi:Zn ribbon nucleic-acid-binding protein
MSEEFETECVKCGFKMYLGEPTYFKQEVDGDLCQLCFEYYGGFQE